MDNLHANQKKILDTLLDHADGCTLEQLSTHLGVSKTATKAHVLRLEHLGHISFTDVKGNVGRPKRYYQLTDSGQEVFPKQYAWISNILLEHLVESQPPEEILEMMTKLADKVVESMGDRFHKEMSAAERVKALNNMLNELGFRSTVKQSDVRKGVTIEAINCVYHSVAKNHPELCQFDLRLIERLSGMKPELESCIAKGQSVCRFCLKGRGVAEEAKRESISDTNHRV